MYITVLKPFLSLLYHPFSLFRVSFDTFLCVFKELIFDQNESEFINGNSSPSLILKSAITWSCIISSYALILSVSVVWCGEIWSGLQISGTQK